MMIHSNYSYLNFYKNDHLGEEEGKETAKKKEKSTFFQGVISK